MSGILITGATGYFGQGMVRHLLANGTMRICIFSRDEAKQAAMRASLPDPEQRLHWFIGDVRDQQRLRRAMQGVNVVIHAAALKRVETGEYDPAEMVKTNVLGTINVIEAAMDEAAHRWSLRETYRVGEYAAGLANQYRAPVETMPPLKVVALSSDKACQPLNAYGASKLMMEKLILGANNARGSKGPIFAVTRYGNVAGSTGSVIPTWRQALNTHTPITITDLNATRFWMTLQEAVNLVTNTVLTMQGGELMIPQLPAYCLGDLYDAMAYRYSDVTPKVVGLGRGEKMHERMEEDGPDSSQVRRMTIDELREALRHV